MTSVYDIRKIVGFSPIHPCLVTIRFTIHATSLTSIYLLRTPSSADVITGSTITQTLAKAKGHPVKQCNVLAALRYLVTL